MMPALRPHPQLLTKSAMFIATLIGTVARYIRYRLQLIRIEDLDDRTLRDIGLDRDELKAAAWDVAAHGH
jgi:uncharacterized protein YjiS (DUF1127 family)